MKKLVLLVFLFFDFAFAYAENDFFDQFEMQQITASYYGISGNSDNIIIYGDWGSILKSTDKGNTWQEINIDKSYTIMDMTENGYLYGLLNEDYIIKSYDGGTTWEKKYLGDYKFHRIKAYNNELYCMSNVKIIVCNTELDILREFDIEVGKINSNRRKSSGDQYNFEIIDDKIYYVSDTLELKILDMQTNKTSTIKIDEYINLSESEKRVPSNFFKTGNVLYFTLSTSLFSFDNETVEKIYTTKKTGIWTGYNNNVYHLYSVLYPVTKVDSIYFYKIISKNNAIRINKRQNDRYISYTSFTSLKLFNENLVIAVGQDKLIYMSYDGGRNWVLKSHMAGKKQSPVYRGSGNQAMYISKYVKFVHSTDNGLTWLPQKTYLPYFVSQNRFGNLLNYGNSTFFNGKGVAFYEERFMENKDTNFIISESNGDVIKLINNRRIAGYPGSPGISDKKNSFFSSQNKLYLFHNSSVFVSWKFSFLFIFDDEMRLTRHNFFDSSHVFLMDTFYDGNIYGLTVNYRNPQKYGKNGYSFEGSLSLIKSTDGGKTFENLSDYNIFNHRIRTDMVLLRNSSKSDDEIFFFLTDTLASEFKMYSINIKTKELNLLGKIPDIFIPTATGIRVIDSMYYYDCVLFGNNRKIIFKLFKNPDPIANPDSWEEIKFHKRYSNVSFRLLNDNTILINAYDSLADWGVLWFAKPKHTTAVVEEPEIQPAIYISEPIPNPASDIVRFNVSHDLNYMFEQASIKVYDILGNIVSRDDEFTVTRRSNHSAGIMWNVTGVGPGVYFITVRLGGETMSKPIVIYR